jgi:hypothetical protein
VASYETWHAFHAERNPPGSKHYERFTATAATLRDKVGL